MVNLRHTRGQQFGSALARTHADLAMKDQPLAGGNRRQGGRFETRIGDGESAWDALSTVLFSNIDQYDFAGFEPGAERRRVHVLDLRRSRHGLYRLPNPAHRARAATTTWTTL